MDISTLTSPCKTKCPHTLAENNSTHLHDASFSSNLSKAEESLVQKLAESKQNQSPTTRKKIQDGEISIFDAEKYFNEGMDNEQSRITAKGGTKHQPKNNEKTGLKSRKPKITPGTPSGSSEASWNSQSALLPVLLNDGTPNRRNKVKRIRFFTTFGCKCYCSDEKSVDINENVGENKSSSNYKKDVDYEGVRRKEIVKVPIKVDMDPIILVGTKHTRPESQFKEEIRCQNFENVSIGSQREDCFTFPVLNSVVGNITIERKFKQKDEEDVEEKEEKARKSLEVFGSPIMDKGDRALSFERKLTMLTWDPNSRVEDIPANSSSGGVYQDVESDSSSDLFEIKSLSGNAQPFFMYRASDGVSSCVTTPTACYEPSEASIEWSVMTTSAPNFAAVSDYDKRKSAAIVTNPEAVIVKSTTTSTTKTTTTTAKNVTGKKVQRRCPNALLDCRSREAVRVAGEKKAKADSRCHRSDCSTPTTANFQIETKVTDFKSAQGQPTFTTRSLSRSLSARASRSLHMN